jgi:Holliday junction resolvase RusA-like endonuclease
VGLRAVHFTIPGRLGGKGRPRFAVVGGQGRAFTPARTRSTEAMVREFAAKAMAGAPPIEGAVHLSVIMHLDRPKSWTKRKIAENPLPTGKPDLDNVLKLLGDALNGIVWKDDSQIASLWIQRRFVVSGGERTDIFVQAATHHEPFVVASTLPVEAA